MVTVQESDTRKFGASMKALPKRKGNQHQSDESRHYPAASMKALPKRKGNFSAMHQAH